MHFYKINLQTLVKEWNILSSRVTRAKRMDTWAPSGNVPCISGYGVWMKLNLQELPCVTHWPPPCVLFLCSVFPINQSNGTKKGK